MKTKLITSTSLVVAALVTGSIAQAQELQVRMGEPAHGLTAAELNRFALGKTQFKRQFNAADGLGPIFNDDSCATCHSTPAIGGASNKFVTRFGKAANGPNPFDALDSLGGSLLQVQAIDPNVQEFVPPQADVTASRVTPSAIGAGFVQAIPDATLLALAANPPSPNVSGIAHMVTKLEDPLGPQVVGRFGWKAQVATMLTFSGDAGLMEMGITNHLVPTEQAPNGNGALLAVFDTVADPEDNAPVGQRIIDRWDDFQRLLAVPPQWPPQGTMSGEVLFNQVGCADCHVTTFVTGAAPEAALSGKVIHPYSDFLLHDMGSLGDGIVQGQGTEKEMRTSALWGVRFRNVLLHDGRVNSGSFSTLINQAVGFHDGEAAASRNAYQALSPADQAKVVAFLDSLGRLEFDVDGDNDRDDIDWFFLKPLFTGPAAGSFNADAAGTIGDSDLDGDFDLADFGRYQRGFTGQP
ncbi:MAG: hypothetical protein JNL94_11590 [Planctomycetes bacterium]|nr:hypothetical protein [Planctomycetota bacterium]